MQILGKVRQRAALPHQYPNMNLRKWSHYRCRYPHRLTIRDTLSSGHDAGAGSVSQKPEVAWL